jgi:hypothetical protein
MARRGDLAGLAALGALGYALTQGKKAPVEDRRGVEVARTFAPDSDRMLYPDESSNTTGDYAPAAPVVRPGRSTASVAATAPAVGPYTDEAVRLARRYPAPAPGRIPGQGGPRGTRYSPTDTGDETARLARRYPAPARQMTREEAISRIPTDSDVPPSVGREPVSGNELTRNIMNTLNATTGLSAPGFVGRETAKQFAARSAARRAAEGLSDAEVADLLRRRALSEVDVMGGATGYKKGGKVKAKKMASGGMAKSSASKRADGIATKGKTKCKMY